MLTIKRTSVPMGSQRRLRKQRIRAFTKSFVELIVGPWMLCLAWFRANGFLTDASKGNVSVEDDGYNLVVVDRQNRMPLFAIEYGT